MRRALLPALLLALAPVAARAGAVSCGCYCGKVISPPCSDAACKQACGWREPGGSAGRGGGGPAYDAEAARREEERRRADEEEARREADELARRREAEARRRAKEFEDARDRTAGMLHGAGGLEALPGGRPSLKALSEPTLAAERPPPRTSRPVLGRVARCAVAPLLAALRGHGPAAVALGADVQRELEAALRPPFKALAPGQDDTVRVFHDLQRESPGSGVRAFADALVVRSGPAGEVHVHLQFSVGRRGIEPTEGQSILHFDRAGRLTNADVADAVRACIEE